MDNINGLSCFSQAVGLKKLCKVKWLQGDYHVDWIKAFELSKRFALLPSSSHLSDVMSVQKKNLTKSKLSS